MRDLKFIRRINRFKLQQERKQLILREKEDIPKSLRVFIKIRLFWVEKQLKNIKI